MSILCETDGSNTITASYTHTLFIDDLISERKLGQTNFRLNDHLGSLRKLTNEAQQITEAVTYDIFGKPNSSSSSRFLFTGRELDSETNLYHYRARAYQPSTGRFTTKDPLGFDSDTNFYSYVGNAPTRFIDPEGLIAVGLPPIGFGGIPIPIPVPITPGPIGGQEQGQKGKGDCVAGGGGQTKGTEATPNVSPGAAPPLDYKRPPQSPKEKKPPKGEDLKGGKKPGRDRDFGIKDPKFWDWWHQEKQKTGAPNIGSTGEAEYWYGQFRGG